MVKRIIAVLSIVGLFMAGFTGVSAATPEGRVELLNEQADTTSSGQEDKVRICHRTNSGSNPYTSNEVSHSAVDGEGNNDHSSHTGPVFDPEVHDQQNRGWGDIIPPVNGVTDGLNYTDEGRAIWKNDCESVDSVPPGKPEQPEPTVVVEKGPWVDGDFECDDTTVEQVREVTTITTPFVYDKDKNDWVPGDSTSETETETQVRDLTEEEQTDCPHEYVRDHGSIIEFCDGDTIFLDVATGDGEWTLTLNDRVDTFTVTPEELSSFGLKGYPVSVSASELPLTVTLARSDGFTPIDNAVITEDYFDDCGVEPVSPEPEEPVVTQEPEITTEVIVDNPPAQREVAAVPAKTDELPRTGGEPLSLALFGLALLGAGVYTVSKARVRA